MNDPMPETVTHLAAPYVAVSGRVVQRCAVCGEKLLDNLNAAMPLRPDGTPAAFPTWRAATYVRFSGSHQWRVGHWDTDELPADFCLPLVE